MLDWLSSFLQVGSYGGRLKYTLSYVSDPRGSSIEDVDVQIIVSKGWSYGHIVYPINIPTLKCEPSTASLKCSNQDLFKLFLNDPGQWHHPGHSTALA